MRFLLNVVIPHDKFNALTKDGSVGKKLKLILDETKPEAVYFTEQHGKRSVLLIVDMADASKIPSLAEPWFLTFNADVEVKHSHPISRGKEDSCGTDFTMCQALA